MIGVLLTLAIAQREGKPAFPFSRFNFTRMKEAGNTHYCFNCGGRHGFQVSESGIVQNIHPDDDTLTEHHSSTCTPAVIGNADKYDNPWDWLEKEVPKNFAHIVHIPSIF